MIESFSFGTMEIDGRHYNTDLIIYPDGHIQHSWWRKRGHVLSVQDIAALIAANPEVIIAGTGVNGLMKPDRALTKQLSKKGIQLMAGSNDRAVRWYNDSYREKPVGACFHLSC